MIEQFRLLKTPKIVFGMGQSDRINELLKGGKRLLIITGANSYAGSGINNLLNSLDQSGFVVSHEKVSDEPSPILIDHITSKYRSAGIEMVISMGGGSALDTGKAVSAMLPVEESIKNYLEGVGDKTHSGKKVFFAAVPTTAGTGSEATANAVISETGINGFKKSLRHENLVPDLAIVDPLLSLSCSPEITANTGMDAFTQLIESFLSAKANPYTDALAMDGIKKIYTGLPAVMADGSNVNARSDMAYAAMLSGITLANAGLGLTHGFASSVGACISIPHGVVCGTLMGVVNKYNITVLKESDKDSVAYIKYRDLGALFSSKSGKSNSWYLDFAAAYLEELAEKFRIKRLGGYGIRETDLPGIAKETDHKSNPVKFGESTLVEMLKERL